jgi:Na+-translocating ferredoxin:NAD+ oxidoreductase RnfG subunit
MKKFKIIFVLAFVAALSGGILAYVESVTTPIIEANAAAEEEEVIKGFFPDLATTEKEEVTIEDSLVDYGITVLDGDNNPIGYVYSATGVNGYGTITAMVGIDIENNIIGIEYPQFGQTPGFGDKVQTPEYLAQFDSLPTDAVEIDGAAGATFSSDLVDDLVNAMADYHNETVGGGQ